MAKKPKEKPEDDFKAYNGKDSLKVDGSAFEPCRQCGQHGDCIRAGKCVKGFK